MSESRSKLMLVLKYGVDHPYRTIIVTLLTLVVLSLGIKGLGFRNDYQVFFGPDNPQLQVFEKIQKTYDRNDNVLFVVEPESGTIFDKNTLLAIQSLTTSAWQLPYASRVDSVTNFQHTIAKEDDLVVADLVLNPQQMNQQALASVKKVALSEPLLVNRLVSTSGHVGGVNVTLQLPDKSAQASFEVAKKVRELAAEIEQQNPGLRLHLSGMVMMNNAFGEAAMQDNKTLVPLMYGIVLITLLLFFRSVMATLAVGVIILGAIFPAMGIAGWLGWYLTPTSAIAPTIILTMTVADCVHFLVTQFHLMREGMSKKDAVLESLRINFKPIFLTSVTTVIGFLSMNFSDAPPFRDLGNMVAIGVTLAFILTVILLPALIVLLPIRKKAGSEASRVIMGCLADLVIRYRRVLLVINTVLAVVLICFAPQNELNDEFVKYFDETVEFRQATEFLTENMGGIYSIEVVVESGDEGGINEPAYLLAVADLVDWFHKQSEVVHVNTLVDTYKRLSKNMHGDNDAWFILPDERNLAAQYLLLYEMSLPYGLDLNNQVNINKSGSRLIVSLKDLSSNQMLAFEQRTRLWVETHLPIYSVEATSPTLMFSHIGKRNIIRMMGGTFCALILISMILMIAFKSIRLGLVSLVPNLIPAGVAFGLWYFIDGRIGLGLSVVTGLTLGIVVDDTVHFISKYRFARQERQMSQEDAVRYAFSTVGVALWITSVVLVSGFAILTLSHFTMNSTMGFMTAMTITVALVMDLLFLPPLLMRMGK